jgi:glycosyltransferase involved in cell wall biosynthesis
VAGFVTEAHPVKRFTSQDITTRIAFTCADAIVSNSKACLLSKRANPKKSYVIYNGFDFARFNAPGFDRNEFRKTLGIEEDQFVATMVARFTPNKDYTMLVEVAEKLKDLNNVVFLAIGKGETLEPTQHLCKEKNVNSIKFLGFRSDVEKILMCSDIGLLFTNDKVHAEGISNSILESMAAGLPVIATDGGGTPEIIEDQKSGFIVKPCDSEAAAAFLRKLYTEKDYRELIGSKAKERILKCFTLDVMTRKYIDFYNNI